MLRRSTVLCFMLFAGACAVNIRQGPPPHVIASDDERLATLSWLEGSWYRAGAGREAEEHWTSARGGTMLGMRRVLVQEGLEGAGASDGGTRTARNDFMQIQYTADGIFYRSAPPGEEPSLLRLVTLDGERAVFADETPGSDRRFVYDMRSAEVGGGSELCLRIEGHRAGQEQKSDTPAAGQPRAMEWCYTRAAPVTD